MTTMRTVWFGALIVAAAASAQAQPGPANAPRPSQVQPSAIPALPPPAIDLAVPFDDRQPPPPPPEPAQTPKPPQATQPGRPAPAPVAVVPPPPPRLSGQPVNVRVDLTISDEGSGSAPVKKVVSVTVADADVGRIRSTATISGVGEVPLHVDARPTIMPDGKIRVTLTINYNLTEGSGVRVPVKENSVNPWKTEIREELGVLLENGKPLIVSQSADPIGDRRVTVEVKVTILR
jgi:hypothetical protein